MNSFHGGMNVPAYTASKHGLLGLTRALANEWTGQGIRVNGIAPGWMETELTRALREDGERYDALLARIAERALGHARRPGRRGGLPRLGGVGVRLGRIHRRRRRLPGALAMRELRPGLWHWQTPHPDWTPGERWPREVSSYAIDDGERLLLFDPLRGAGRAARA